MVLQVLSRQPKRGAIERLAGCCHGMKIAVLGAGAWGTALALSLQDRHQVTLWGRDVAAMNGIDACRENAVYLPGFSLPAALQVSADLVAILTTMRAGTIADSEDGGGLLIVATSVAGLRPLCERLKKANEKLNPDCHAWTPLSVVVLCKGFEQDTMLLPDQVVREVLGDNVQIGVLSGPSFAQEVARGLPCALTIASSNHALRTEVVRAFHARNLRIYTTDDVIGVEVGGAVKNVLAIATGVIDGLGFGANARAALITRGLAEITRLGVALGGRSETFMGLTGVGDLLLTCTGDLSRNRQVGLGLAQGKPLSTIVADLGHVAEGVRCAAAVRALALKVGVDMPITAAVAGVLFDGDSATSMVTKLLSRDSRREGF
jgi:glycerol-3-phosphate dehydrogenase (NAD(P)+)